MPEMVPFDLVRWWDVRMFLKFAQSISLIFVIGARKGAPSPLRCSSGHSSGTGFGRSLRANVLIK